MTLRVAIAGSGFVGKVHARSARLAGARLAGVAASSPESAQAAAAALGAERPFASAEQMVRDADVDVVHICTPNHLHVPLAEAALAAGKHVICEKPLALDAAGAQRLDDAATGSGLQAGGAVRLPLLPDRARGARARRQPGDRSAAPAARHLSAGLAPASRRRQLARGREPGRRVARVRGHRLALVRPGGVHLRSSHRPPVRTAAHRGARAVERGRPQGVRVGRRRGRGAAGHDRGRRRRPVRDGRRGAGVGRRQPDLGGSQEPALDGAGRRRGGTRLRPGAAGGALVRAPGGRDDRSPRSRDAVAGRRAIRGPPRRPSAGLRGLLRRVRGRLLRLPSATAPRRTGCRRSPTACAPR